MVRKLILWELNRPQFKSTSLPTAWISVVLAFCTVNFEFSGVNDTVTIIRVVGRRDVTEVQQFPPFRSTQIIWELTL
jgi:hypothetical protein